MKVGQGVTEYLVINQQNNKLRICIRDTELPKFKDLGATHNLRRSRRRNENEKCCWVEQVENT